MSVSSLRRIVPLPVRISFSAVLRELSGAPLFVFQSGFIRGLLLCLFIEAQLAAADPPTSDLDSLAWLAGSWKQANGDTEVEEHWLSAKGGLMLGLGRTTRGKERPASFEFLRIARTKQGLSYFASPQGRPATEFPLVEQTKDKVAFENPKHDFPQRISYWLDEIGRLHARIEGTIKGEKRQQEWTFEKAK